MTEEGQEQSEEDETSEDMANRTRSGQRVVIPSRYMHVTWVNKEKWKTEVADIAIKAELRMLFEELQALRCVKRVAMKAGTKI